jgi:hypothetical protein
VAEMLNTPSPCKYQPEHLIGLPRLVVLIAAHAAIGLISMNKALGYSTACI